MICICGKPIDSPLSMFAVVDGQPFGLCCADDALRARNGGVPATDSRSTDGREPADSSSADGWAVLELMGHRKLAGRISEVVVAGVPMLRLDVPDSSEDGWQTQYYAGSALFSVTPTTEELARRFAEAHRPVPVHRYELPALAADAGEEADPVADMFDLDDDNP